MTFFTWFSLHVRSRLNSRSAHRPSFCLGQAPFVQTTRNVKIRCKSAQCVLISALTIRIHFWQSHEEPGVGSRVPCSLWYRAWFVSRFHQVLQATAVNSHDEKGTRHSRTTTSLVDCAGLVVRQLSAWWVVRASAAA